MPFLFWLPMIVMSGLLSVAEDNSRASIDPITPDR
jgi:hypothetical protein